MARMPDPPLRADRIARLRCFGRSSLPVAVFSADEGVSDPTSFSGDETSFCWWQFTQPELRRLFSAWLIGAERHDP